MAGSAPADRSAPTCSSLRISPRAAVAVLVQQPQQAQADLSVAARDDYVHASSGR